MAEYTIEIDDEDAERIDKELSQERIREVISEALLQELTREDQIAQKQEDLRRKMGSSRIDEQAELEVDSKKEADAIAEKQAQLRNQILDN